MEKNYLDFLRMVWKRENPTNEPARMSYIIHWIGMYGFDALRKAEMLYFDALDDFDMYYTLKED